MNKKKKIKLMIMSLEWKLIKKNSKNSSVSTFKITVMKIVHFPMRSKSCYRQVLHSHLIGVSLHLAELAVATSINKLTKIKLLKEHLDNPQLFLVKITYLHINTIAHSLQLNTPLTT